MEAPDMLDRGRQCLPWSRGVKLIFTQGHISLVVAFKGPNVIWGLYKCNYSLTRGKELSAAARWRQGAGRIKQRGGLDSAAGLVFATCALERPKPAERGGAYKL